MNKPWRCFISFFAVALCALIVLQPIQLVSASPGSATYDARPQAYSTDLKEYPTSKWTLKDAANAYDNNEATFAYLECDVDGFFNLTTFTSLTDPWRIVKVDFKIKYGATVISGKNDEFRIDYYVGPSPSNSTLQVWTDAGTGVMLATYTWYQRSEPNNGVWSWTDVGNIRVSFETLHHGGTDDFAVEIYEVWAVVTYRNPSLSVLPADQSVSASFTIDINITSGDDIYSWEFNVTYDTSILTATDATEGPFLKSAVPPGNTTFNKMINDTNGWVYAYCSIIGDQPGVTGSGTLATISFDNDATGTSSLDLHDSKLIEYNFVTKTSYNFPPFHRIENDGSVTVTAVVPEFPLGTAMEIALAAVVIYVWWMRKRPKNTSIQSTIPSTHHRFTKLQPHR